jgi:hypothetical protein
MSISRLEVLYETKTLKAHNRLKIVFKIHFNLLNPIFVKIENPHSKNGKIIRKKKYSYYEAGEGRQLLSTRPNGRFK